VSNSNPKPCSEACERNRIPILEVLRGHFADRRHVLEIGSGTGQHAVHFAAALPQLTWQTSDLEPSLPGIRSWIGESGLPNLPQPIALDVTGPWPDTRFDAVFTANTLHIMGWPEVCALFAALPKALTADAVLAVYGPFNYDGRFTSPSNAAFDGSLRRQNPEWGVRDTAELRTLAEKNNLRVSHTHELPSNNAILSFEQSWW